MFHENFVLQNFAKFIRKHLYWSFFFNKMLGGLQVVKKRHICVIRISQNFWEHFFVDRLCTSVDRLLALV